MHQKICIDDISSTTRGWPWPLYFILVIKSEHKTWTYTKFFVELILWTPPKAPCFSGTRAKKSSAAQRPLNINFWGNCGNNNRGRAPAGNQLRIYSSAFKVHVKQINYFPHTFEFIILFHNTSERNTEYRNTIMQRSNFDSVVFPRP